MSYTYTDSDGVRMSKEVIRVVTASTGPKINFSTKKDSLDLRQQTIMVQKVPIFTPKTNSKILEKEPAVLQRFFNSIIK